MLKEAHPFAGVYLYSPIEPGFGHGRVLAPVDASQFASFTPEALRDNLVVNADPTKMQLHVVHHGPTGTPET